MKYVFWAGVVVFCVLDIALYNADFSIPVAGDIALYTSPHTPEAVVLSHETRGRLIDAVERYAVIRGNTVVGQSAHGFFIISPKGDVRTYVEKAAWLAACTASGAKAPLELRKPSRRDDPLQWKLHGAVYAVLGAWIALGFMLARRHRGERSRGDEVSVVTGARSKGL